jgi:hypothetical protein
MASAKSNERLPAPARPRPADQRGGVMTFPIKPAAVAAGLALALAVVPSADATVGKLKIVPIGTTVTLRGAQGQHLRARAYDFRLTDDCDWLTGIGGACAQVRLTSATPDACPCASLASSGFAGCPPAARGSVRTTAASRRRAPWSPRSTPGGCGATNSSRGCSTRTWPRCATSSCGPETSTVPIRATVRDGCCLPWGYRHEPAHAQQDRAGHLRTARRGR